MTNDDYLGEIDDDHYTINGLSAGTVSVDVRTLARFTGTD